MKYIRSQLSLQGGAEKYKKNVKKQDIKYEIH